MRRSVPLLGVLVALLVPVLASAGVRADGVMPLPNADFASGLAGWSQSSSIGGQPILAVNAPGTGEPAAFADLPAGAWATLEQVLAVDGPGLPAGTPTAGAPGDKLELDGRVRFAGALPGRGASAQLELVADTPAGPLTIGRSRPLTASGAPADSWLWLHTTPAEGDGRIPVGARSLRLRWTVWGPGPVWLERVVAGRFEYAGWPLVGADFEGGVLHPAWSTNGDVSASTPGVETDAYYGAGYLELGGSLPASAQQSVPVTGGPGAASPRREVEAGVWVHLEPGVGPSGATDTSAAVSVEVLAVGAGKSQLVAHESWQASAADVGRWIHLEAQALPGVEVPLDATHLVLRVVKHLAGVVRVDHAQLGERFGIDGNPKRHVTGNYVGHFRSPLGAEAVSTPPNSQEIWRNWSWTMAPACDPSFTAFAHQPDCAASPGCYRLNGRRDGAVSVEASPDDLPLVGAYDSRDRDVLRYHVALAQAAGLDSFTYLHQGHTLAQQSIGFGLEPVNERTFEVLLDVAEEPGVNFKLALMYEPKVHFNGWVQGEPTLAAKKAGIAADLVHLVETTRPRKAALRRDGRLVVFLFRNDVCDPSGAPCLSASDWAELHAQVLATTGEDLFLVADVPAAQSNVFAGLSRWDLVSLPMLRYRTWDQVSSAQPAFPAPEASAARAHSDSINAVAAVWSAEEDSARIAVALAWPGFDDSGVAGWGAPNLNGEDGAPLCVRIAPDLDGAFFGATLDGAFASGADWIQIATWNDWNEETRVEPVWRSAYHAAVLAGVPPPAASVDEVFARSLRLQAAIAEFKGLRLGLDLLPAKLDAIARDYLSSAQGDPSVVAYD